MRNAARIGLVIPALNEERAIGRVLDAVPSWVDQTVVADNGSTDLTRQIASQKGAIVVHEARAGYGSACLRGIAELDPCDIVVFVDADFSDHPEQMDRLVDPIIRGDADLVIGSRRLGVVEPGALTIPQRFGNTLACALIWKFWGVRFTDLGPFRAVRSTTLTSLGMADPDYGWTVEMQIKAAMRSVRCLEVPVDYRRRIGRSKISGTVRGVIAAGTKILSTIFLTAAKQRIPLARTAQRRRLIVFTRFPIPSETKTRMIPLLGPAGAAELQRAMTEHTLRNARSLMHVQIEIRHAGGSEVRMREWLGDDLSYAGQGEGNLGIRMRRAFESAFADGVGQAVIVGTDCPGLSPTVLKSAFDALAKPRIALGPATDGGYYLIGIEALSARRSLPLLFEGVDWGTESVYAQTLDRARGCGVAVQPLVPLSDVDCPADMPVWERVQPGAVRPLLSVIIPALNEADSIPTTIERLLNLESIEILVVDGGSTDRTVELATKMGARVVKGPRGRGIQMNRGAAHAAGRYLLFLHADTHLPQCFADEVHRVLSDPRVALGAFTFDTDDQRAAMKWISFCANLRSRWLGLPYGDQAYFLRQETFQSLRGFSEIPIMEDYVLARSASKVGRIRISRLHVITSARRSRRLGPWRAVLYNQAVVAGFLIGLDPAKLAAFYRRPAEPRSE